MILTDTGPIVALFDRMDAHFARVSSAMGRTRDVMATTDACLTEATYLLSLSVGWPAVEMLHKGIIVGEVEILPIDQACRVRAFAYMKRFLDQPCDYADATILVLAEETGLRRVFTVDRHFRAYRLTSGEALDVIP